MPEIEISDQRRRLVLDGTLAAMIVACILAFADLRSNVTAQTKAFEQVTKRLDAVEEREQTGASNVATKADIARIEGRLDNIAQTLINRGSRE